MRFDIQVLDLLTGFENPLLVRRQVIAVPAIREQRPVYVGHLVVHDELYPQVVAILTGKAFVITAQVLEELQTNHRTRAVRRLVVQGNLFVEVMPTFLARAVTVYVYIIIIRKNQPQLRRRFPERCT